MNFEPFFVAIISALFGLLVVVLGWIGSRVHQRLDSLTVMLDTRLTELGTTMYGIKEELKDELNNHHTRLSIVENHCKGDKP